MEFLSALAWYHPAKLEIVEWTNTSTQGMLTKYLRLPLNKRPGAHRSNSVGLPTHGVYNQSWPLGKITKVELYYYHYLN
jgi:hypothetical protein